MARFKKHTRIVTGFDATGQETFRKVHHSVLADVCAPVQADQIIEPKARLDVHYAVVTDKAGQVVYTCARESSPVTTPACATMPASFDATVLDIDTAVDRWAARVVALAAHAFYGPAFIRGVRDELVTAVRMARTGRTDDAEYFLGLAEKAHTRYCH